MHFVVGKNDGYTRKNARRVVIHTRKRSDEVDTHFYHNPVGGAYFAAHVVASLADMNNYPTRAASCGPAKYVSRKMYKLYVYRT